MSPAPRASSPLASPLLAALHASGGLPEALQRFDEGARGSSDEPDPSFEEYSARIGDSISPWRETCYFDVGSEPRLAALANARFVAIARALDVEVPAPFIAALAQASGGPEVLQIVLGIDADPKRLRLKYYLIYRGPSGASVECLRRALALPPLPESLAPDSVYILGIDFESRTLSDFKLYVRLDPARVPRVIRNLREVEALWRGSRYLVFQHCLLGPGRQVYFHASSAALLEHWLAARSEHDPLAADFWHVRLARINTALAAAGHPQRLRPWIASLPYARGVLSPAPSNIYFHFSERT